MLAITATYVSGDRVAWLCGAARTPGGIEEGGRERERKRERGREREEEREREREREVAPHKHHVTTSLNQY